MASDSRTVAGDHADEPVTPGPNLLRVVPQADRSAVHSDAHRGMRVVDLQREALEARLGEARAVRERTLSERRAARSEHRVAELEGRLQALLDERTLARRESTGLGLRAEALERRLETAQAELGVVRDALAERDAAIADRDATLAERDGKVAERDVALAELRREVTDQRAELDRLRKRSQQLTDLRGSRSYALMRRLWRVHALLRRPFRRRRRDQDDH